MENQNENKNENNEMIYLNLWKDEEENNEIAQEESFNKSQQDEKVLREQYKEDIEELEIKNPNCKNIPIRYRDSKITRKIKELKE